MEDQLFHNLCDLNTRFYRKTAESFSSTRQSAWQGWEHLADIVEGRLATSRASQTEGAEARTCGSLHVVDLACGNLRFETFLESRLPDALLAFTVVDNCDGFPCTPVESPCKFVRADLVEWLRNEDGAGFPPMPKADLAVSFGFMHHIPGKDTRTVFLQLMANLLAPGGIGAVSLWDFAQDPKMAAKAEASTARAETALSLPDLEEGDYILGWQNDAEAFRYCHSFSPAEIDGLERALPPHTRTIGRFRADGRTGTLNTYLVFERKG
ncbi:MAG: class I SAM-dependent methyltransferase [Eggerthellaceae bacterium]